MKTKRSQILFGFLILSVSMTGWAFASNHINLLNDGAVKLERIPSKCHYYISYVNVYQNDGELVIYGHVKRRSRIGGGSGHVDIAIVSPDGKVLERISTLHKPQIILTRKMHTRKSTFEVRLPTIPPTGSKVRVAYHRDSRPNGRTFSCSENMAVSNARIF